MQKAPETTQIALSEFTKALQCNVSFDNRYTQIHVHCTVYTFTKLITQNV